MSAAGLWKYLEEQVDRRAQEFPGVAGISVKDLARGDGFAVRGDEEFPTASSIKIHILTQLLLREERGEIDLSERVLLTPEMDVSGSGVLTYLEGELELSWLDIAILMIIVSDNTATNLCIDLAGMEATNALLRDLGLERTTLRRKMQDQEAVARNVENVGTPNEFVKMLELLHSGRPTPGVAQRCLAILKKAKAGTLFSRVIPPTVPLANKPGGMDRVRCDAGIVYLPRRPYAMTIMTKFAICDHADQEWFIIDTARLIHKTLSLLDVTSDHGQGLPPALLNR
jgi:beta-lactamase class A